MTKAISKPALILFFLAVCVAFLPAEVLAEGDIAPPLPSVEDITIITRDGVSLRGTYYAPTEPGPAVLLIHRCRGDADRANWTDVATRLDQSGIHTLTFDLRGYGESSGGEPPFTTMANFISFWRTTGMNDLDAAYRGTYR